MSVDDRHEIRSVPDLPDVQAIPAGDPDNWTITNSTGRVIGIIWRTTMGWRCAPPAGHPEESGLLHGDFDTVLRHAAATFTSSDR